jgi:type VI protein secretion system component Hcp
VAAPAWASPIPGKLNFEHYFDTSSTVILGYICTGKAFPKLELQMMKTTARAARRPTSR